MVHALLGHRVAADDHRIGQAVLQRQPVGIERIATRNQPPAINAAHVEAPVFGREHAARLAGIEDRRGPGTTRRPQHEHADDGGAVGLARILHQREGRAGAERSKLRPKRHLRGDPFVIFIDALVFQCAQVRFTPSAESRHVSGVPDGPPRQWRS